MAKVCGRNVHVNFNYCSKAVVLFMSMIVVNKLRAFHTILFRKREKDLKYFIKLNVDIQFSFIINNAGKSCVYRTFLLCVFYLFLFVLRVHIHCDNFLKIRTVFQVTGIESQR